MQTRFNCNGHAKDSAREQNRTTTNACNANASARIVKVREKAVTASIVQTEAAIFTT
jgi:hypothetical protein